MTDAPGYVSSPFLSQPAASGCASTPDVFSPQAPSDGSAGTDRNAGGHFVLGQNYPNPHTGETTVPFILHSPADVRLDILDLMGRKVAGVVRKGRTPGAQSIKLNLTGLGLPPGDYLYQLQVTMRHGVYQQSKLMTTE